MSVRVFAPAKINLTLEVGPPREDGLHPLQSVVMFADVGDWIEATPAETLSLTITGPFAQALQNEPDNLVLRAARALGEGRGAALTLEKNLPIASGIGGGSSDAAAALKALAELWDMRDADLHAIARTLGADVPVCVSARASYMTGAGELFTPIDAPSFAAVLINPLKPLPTAQVYRAFDALDWSVGALSEAPAPEWKSRAEALRDLPMHGNDLFPAASQLLPEINEMLDVLDEDPRVLWSDMSGSGATVFALMENRADAAELAAKLRMGFPGWWIADTLLGAP